MISKIVTPFEMTSAGTSRGQDLRWKPTRPDEVHRVRDHMTSKKHLILKKPCNSVATEEGLPEQNFTFSLDILLSGSRKFSSFK